MIELKPFERSDFKAGRRAKCSLPVFRRQVSKHRRHAIERIDARLLASFREGVRYLGRVDGAAVETGVGGIKRRAGRGFGKMQEVGHQFFR